MRKTNKQNQVSLKSLFEKKKRPNSNEIAGDTKTEHKKKVAFKRKYQKSYVNYKLIATGYSYSARLLCIIWNDQI